MVKRSFRGLDFPVIKYCILYITGNYNNNINDLGFKNPEAPNSEAAE